MKCSTLAKHVAEVISIAAVLYGMLITETFEISLLLVLCLGIGITKLALSRWNVPIEVKEEDSSTEGEEEVAADLAGSSTDNVLKKHPACRQRHRGLPGVTRSRSGTRLLPDRMTARRRGDMFERDLNMDQRTGGANQGRRFNVDHRIDRAPTPERSVPQTFTPTRLTPGAPSSVPLLRHLSTSSSAARETEEGYRLTEEERANFPWRQEQARQRSVKTQSQCTYRNNRFHWIQNGEDGAVSE